MYIIIYYTFQNHVHVTEISQKVVVKISSVYRFCPHDLFAQFILDFFVQRQLVQTKTCQGRNRFGPSDKHQYRVCDYVYFGPFVCRIKQV